MAKRGSNSPQAAPRPSPWLLPWFMTPGAAEGVFSPDRTPDTLPPELAPPSRAFAGISEAARHVQTPRSGPGRNPKRPEDLFTIPQDMRPSAIERLLGTQRKKDFPELRGAPITRSRQTAADGGTVDDLSPIDSLRLRTELANRETPSDQQRAKTGLNTIHEIAGMMPVTGNAMAAADAYEAGGDALRSARKGDWKNSAWSGLGAALSGAGALSPVPWSARAGRAAKLAKDTANVFVPVEEGKLSQVAREMREAGAPNEAVHSNTGMFFGPDGSLRRTVDDSKMDLDFGYKPGDKTTVGAFVNHPTLFREMPGLQNRVVNITDKLDSHSVAIGQPRGIARTDPKTGDFEISTAGLDPHSDIAKLLQYDINDRVGYSSAGRHNFNDQIADIATARLRAARSDASPEAIAAYQKAMQRPLDEATAGLLKPRPDRFKDLGRTITDKVAGSVDAKVVKGMAQTRKIPSSSVYPYDKNAPWWRGHYQLPDFEDMTVLPPANMTRADWTQFLEDYYRYGSGRPKFANGGRTAATSRALVGALKGDTGGRDDALEADVPAGSYVVPADVVAALGGGNSMAGLSKLEKQFPPRRANGGPVVPILISDGEYVIAPEAVAALGDGDLDYGHEVLDAFVVQTRQDYAQHLTQLPEPNK
jgi:hypothetical protein